MSLGTKAPWMVLALAAATPAWCEVEIGADLTTASAYVWRGLTVVSGPVLQPSAYVTRSFGSASVSASIWSNIELGKYDGASDVSESGGTSAFNVAEVDPSLELSLPLGNHALALGVDGFLYTNDTGYTADDNAAEIWARLEIALPGSPSLSVWHDVTRIDGSYAELGLSHSHALTEAISLELATAAGWSLSQGNELRADGSVREPGNFSDDGFTHWEGSAGLTLAWRRLTITPSLAFVIGADPWVRLASASDSRDLKIWGAISIASSVGPAE